MSNPNPKMSNKGCNPFWYSFDGVVYISSDYKDDENIRAFIQKTTALSFVPISFVLLEMHGMLLKQICLKMHDYKIIPITLNLLGSMVTSACGTIFQILAHAQTTIWKDGTIE